MVKTSNVFLVLMGLISNFMFAQSNSTAAGGGAGSGYASTMGGGAGSGMAGGAVSKAKVGSGSSMGMGTGAISKGKVGSGIYENMGARVIPKGNIVSGSAMGMGAGPRVGSGIAVNMGDRVIPKGKVPSDGGVIKGGSGCVGSSDGTGGCVVRSLDGAAGSGTGSSNNGSGPRVAEVPGARRISPVAENANQYEAQGRALTFLESEEADEALVQKSKRYSPELVDDGSLERAVRGSVRNSRGFIQEEAAFDCGSLDAEECAELMILQESNSPSH